jgi:hypothetical protein
VSVNTERAQIRAERLRCAKKRLKPPPLAEPVKERGVTDPRTLRTLITQVRARAKSFVWGLALRCRECGARFCRERSEYFVPGEKLLLMAVTEADWNHLMDLLPRCECGRIVFPNRVGNGGRTARRTCSQECYHRRASRNGSRASHARDNERHAIADALYQAGV